MNKAPNKLTSGLRKVKENPSVEPAPRKRTQPVASMQKVSRDDVPAAPAVRVERDAGKHPGRVWPD